MMVPIVMMVVVMGVTVVAVRMAAMPDSDQLAALELASLLACTACRDSWAAPDSGTALGCS